MNWDFIKKYLNLIRAIFLKNNVRDVNLNAELSFAYVKDGKLAWSTPEDLPLTIDYGSFQVVIDRVDETKLKSKV